MKIQLLVVGASPKSYLKEGEELYSSRLNNYIPFEKLEITDLKNAKNLSKEQIKFEEGNLILNKLKPTDFVVLLDEKGKSFRSTDFAAWLQEIMNQGPKKLVFVVGGAYGFSEEVYNRANRKISLSDMTFTHQMIRLLYVVRHPRVYS